ncbi:MAG: hypothetical protein VKK04_06065 [Synechococcales bacterium]|nr:hypothetical protein [Synechococcales bacterium]
MATVLIIVDDEGDEGQVHPKQMLPGNLISPFLEQAIADTASKRGDSERGETISTIRRAGLSPSLLAGDPIVCPLTFDLPDFLMFAGRSTYLACQDVAALRRRVAQQFAYAVGEGDLWLPIVLTAHGPLYGEAIGRAASPADTLLSAYQQPVHLGDRWRQPLYRLGQRLLTLLDAPPAVYLLQFGLQEAQLCFDRLFPFPAAPAIASIHIQTPNLFQCHWRCLTHQPILDLTILPPRSLQ